MPNKAPNSLNAAISGVGESHLGGHAGVTRASFSKSAGRLGQRLRSWAVAEQANSALWMPVFLAIGIGFYFSLKTEPTATLALVSAVILLALSLTLTRYRVMFVAALCVCAGFLAADFRTSLVTSPVVSRDLGIVMVTGRIFSIDESSSAQRIILDVAAIEGLAQERLPQRVRLTWKGDKFNAQTGDLVSLRAGLGPPPPPVIPGGFDFGRRLFFERIGGIGFAVSPPSVLAQSDAGVNRAMAMKIEAIRLRLFRRIIASAPGEGGAIIAAIVTGKRDAISERSRDALRDAGLAHLLAISGLHMGLATGLVFFSVRFLLSLYERAALRYPIKKWAALAALLSGWVYLILSGGGWSARRAFIMTSIIFIAILLDRRALSLRNVAIAATIILLTTPEALIHPGFQMSFAAVTALIAAFEWWTARNTPNPSFSVFARARRYLLALGATDTIAALATAPFALYHFNRVAIYSLPANLASMPIMGFWIMPACVLGIVLIPTGLDVWAWQLAALGMETVLAVATSVSSKPGAVHIVPQWPMSVLLVLTAGGLWLCLARAPWRLAGLAVFPVCMVVLGSQPSPSLFVAPSGRNVGVESDGALLPFTTRRDRFAVKIWNETLGFKALPTQPTDLQSAWACDEAGCTGRVGETLSVAVVEERGTLSEDCARADIVIAFFPVDGRDWSRCSAALIDRRSVWRRGAHAIYLTEDGGFEVQTVRDKRGDRPWTVY